MNDEDDNTDDDTNCEEVTNTIRSFVVDQNDVSEEPVEGLRDDSGGGAVHMDDHVTHGQTIGIDQAVHLDEPD